MKKVNIWNIVRTQLSADSVGEIFDVRHLAENHTRSTVLRYRQYLTDCGYLIRVKRFKYKIMKPIPKDLTTTNLIKEWNNLDYKNM